MAAKQGAGYITQMVLQDAEQEGTNNILPDPDIAVEQRKASPEEKSMWLHKGAVHLNNGWVGPDVN